jgi:hypothetical protein
VSCKPIPASELLFRYERIVFVVGPVLMEPPRLRPAGDVKPFLPAVKGEERNLDAKEGFDCCMFRAKDTCSFIWPSCRGSSFRSSCEWRSRLSSSES